MERRFERRRKEVSSYNVKLTLSERDQYSARFCWLRADREFAR